MTKNKTAAKKTEDQSVVYKVPAAFALMIVVVYGVLEARRVLQYRGRLLRRFIRCSAFSDMCFWR